MRDHSTRTPPTLFPNAKDVYPSLAHINRPGAAGPIIYTWQTCNAAIKHIRIAHRIHLPLINGQSKLRAPEVDDDDLRRKGVLE